VPVERDAVVDGLLGRAARPDPPRVVGLGPLPGVAIASAAGEVVVVAGGVGMAAAAASTAAALACGAFAGGAFAGGAFDLVLSAGIAGGFGDLPIGSLVVGARSIAVDLGCQTDVAFLPLSQMGLGVDTVDSPAHWRDVVAARSAASGIPVTVADIGSVSTITGTAESAAAHLGRHGAAAEAMEGFGVATAATVFDVPFVEVRSISNAVGPRNVSSWRIPEALSVLGGALGSVFAEEWPW
jgi:futalosine hydrolase